MKGIALFAPDEKSFEQANRILGQEKYSVVKCKLIETNHAVEEAEAAIEEGMDIIVARGKQAYSIKRHTKAIVVEIMLTAQELGLLVMKAKKLVDKERPRIGLFGWGNTLSDTSHFDDLYGVDLRRYTMYREEDRVNSILAVERDKLDVVIGGEGMLRVAESSGIPGIYLAGTGESLRVALNSAENTLRVLEKQQHNEKQLAYVMDVMNQGVISLNKNGEVSFVNATMEKIMGINRNRVVGQHFLKYLKGMDEEKVYNVCAQSGEGFSFFYKYHGNELYVMVDPVVTSAGNDGAVLVFDTSTSAQQVENRRDKLLSKEGKWVCRTFDDISKDMKNLQEIVVQAKLFAKSSSPILIEGVTGTEMEVICEGIHSYSNRSNGPYFMINVTGMDDEQQRKVLFGDYGVGRNEPGMIEKANHGTLVIGSVDKLALQNQYKLAQYIRNKILSDAGEHGNYLVDTRIIAYSAKNLSTLRQKYLFRSDLYFMLKSLKLRIPSLRERSSDVECLLEEYMKQYMKMYERYHVLTAGAKKVLLEYPWDGNSMQLQTFCERMILTANKRSITEEYVRNLLDELYTADEGEKDEKWMPEENSEEDPFRKLIDQTLRKYNGNRTLTAKELKMSTTTLWRKMKKYGLD